MAEGVGEFLYALRMSRQIALNELAERAIVTPRTLSNWERGVHQPRLPEMEAVLDALDVTEAERTQALALVKAPRAARLFHTEPHIHRLNEEIGPMPAGGDLLRAMRHRRRYTLEQAAEAIGVSPGTLSRWEQGKVIPPPERLDALLTLLSAHPKERAVLSDGFLFLVPPLGETAESGEALWERFRQFQASFYAYMEENLCELCYLTFAAQAWPLATRSLAGRRVLAHIYANYAAYLECFHRFGEAEQFANRALDLLPDLSALEDFFVRAAIVSANAAVHRSGRPVPQRGLESLRAWLPLAPGPEFEAWMLGYMAEYIALDGNMEEALALSKKACRLVEGCDNPRESIVRKFHLAKLELRAGHAEEALMLANLWPRESPFRRADVELLWVEGLLALDDASAAHDWFERADADIENYALAHLRPRAEALARQF